MYWNSFKQEQWESEYKTEFSLKQYIGRINTAFGVHSVEKIVEALKKDGSPWAKEILEEFQKASPLSLKVTFDLLRRGQDQNLSECLKMEYRVSQNILQHDDFYSGVGARKCFWNLVFFS